MSNQNLFDEDEAVKFIRRELPENVNMQYTDDEILYVIDIIWDYYEKEGLLELNSELTDEEELDVNDLTEYVKKQLARDKEFLMDPKDVGLIVKGELDYEESLEDFV
jgi:hypothetical protein